MQPQVVSADGVYLTPGISTGAPTPMTSMGYATPGVHGGPPVPIVQGGAFGTAGGGGAMVVQGVQGGGVVQGGRLVQGGGDGDCGVGCGSGAGAGCGAGYDDATVMSHVGPLQGDYKMKTYYEYVGNGVGDHDAVRVPTNVTGCYAAVIVSICLVLPVLLLLLHALSSEGVPPTPAPPVVLPPPAPAPTLPPAGTCTFWGDPHFWTFDDPSHTHEEDEYANHDYWLVKTDDIWIQGRYRPTEWLKKRGNHRACMHGIGFAGRFMLGSKMIVEALNGQITYNGQPILTSFTSSFRHGHVSGSYGSSGAPNDPRMSKMELRILHLNFPQGVTAQIDRWKEHIDGKISIPPEQAKGATGHCGNYNGNPKDDVMTTLDSLGGHSSLISTHVVPANQRIFPPSTFNDPLSGQLVGKGAAFNE